MIQMRPSVAVSAVVNSIRQFYDAGSGVTQTTMLGASGSAPALYEDFTTGQALDPRITFTRASSATSFDSNGTLVTVAINEPRFDYDPVTLQLKGLLIEEQRTNLLLQSEDLGTTWGLGAGGTLTANAWTTPAGTVTGDIFTIANDATVPSQSATVANSTAFTLSFYFNKSLTTAAFFRLRFGTAAGSVSAFISVSTAAFGTQGAGTSNAVIQQISANVYRASITMTYGAADAGSRSVAIAGVIADNTTVADTGKNIAIWGIQFEQGSFPTSYIPTTTSAATRAADVAVMTGTNFSSWYRQDEGTLFVEVAVNGSKPNSAFVRVQNAGLTEYIQMRQNSGGAQVLAQVVSAGGSTPGLAQSNYVVGTPFKLALANKSADAAASFNGAAASTSNASTTVPVVDRLHLYDVGAYYLRRITYYPRRLTDAELQALTA